MFRPAPLKILRQNWVPNAPAICKKTLLTPSGHPLPSALRHQMLDRSNRFYLPGQVKKAYASADIAAPASPIAVA
jgi:hypothetical protein